MNVLNILFAISIAASLTVCVSSLRCWTCENARSPKHCKKTGQAKQCRFNEKSCQTEVRISEGYKTIIRTGCKEAHACNNNEIQNPRRAWLPTQCNGDKKNSVCRCCCQTNNCNKRNLLCEALEITPKETTKAPTTTTAKPTPADDEAPPSRNSTNTCTQLPYIPNNGERTCDGKGELGTKCSFSCHYGYKLKGSFSTACEYHHKIPAWTHESPVCVQTLPYCPDLGSFPHGEMVCTDTGNKVGTVCGFQCLDKGYELRSGDLRNIECVMDGGQPKWNHRKPFCDYKPESDYTEPSPDSPSEATCTQLPYIPNNGERICDGEGELGTKCSFSCHYGYNLNGSFSTVCEYHHKTPAWTHESPVCVQTLPYCPDLGSFPHGEMVCTDTGNKVGTVCGFQCLDEGYELRSSDPGIIECVMDGGQPKWNHRKPCCSSQCPAGAKKDVVIVMDSSSSISRREWQTMKEFVANVIGKFEVSSEGVQFAIYRFFRRVDTEHQVHFGDFESDNEGLKDAVLNLPKKGSGTYIGRALRHARDNVLTNGNREDVKDLVWILTDGRSDDETDEIAQELRDSGVEIMALGISRRGKDVFEDELVRIAGDRTNVLEVTRGMRSLNEDLVDRIVGKICETFCEI